jgi:DNA ligase 1
MRQYRAVIVYRAACRLHRTSLRNRIFLLLALLCFALPIAATPEDQFLLAQVMPKGIDPSAYLVSEKYDGVRAIWNGKVFQLRSGAVVAAPSWYTSKLPKVTLDGELWIARGQFDRLSGIVRQINPVDADWKDINYMVFELPNAPGSFAERVQAIQSIVDKTAFARLQAVPQSTLSSPQELLQRMKTTVRAGGEGLMLHLANAPYQTGRSDVLLKLKPLDDAEATVLRHLPGKGRLEGMMGALEVQLADGKVFRIGTGFTDAIRKNPPPIGSSVTFTYRGFTKRGLPRFAVFMRERTL